MNERCFRRFRASISRLFGRRQKPEGFTKEFEQRLARLDKLSWLADVPLFIDEMQVARFHDAVVRPDYQLTKVVENASSEKVKELKGSLAVNTSGKFSLPAYLQVLGLQADVKAGGEAKGEYKRGSKSGESEGREYTTITSAERQLEDLTSYYLLHHRNRILFDDGPLEGELPAGKQWFHYDSGIVNVVPRAIGFLDLPKGRKLIPTAAEFANGKIVLLLGLRGIEWESFAAEGLIKRCIV
jgi:hypothetical protein